MEDDITNTNPLGRVWNVVQHPTLGPPFLDWDTVVDSNATTGFAQAPRVAPGEDNVQLPVSAAERQYFTFPETTNQVILPPAPGVSNEGGSSPLLALLPTVSWAWVPAWGSLEPPRRDGENAQKTRKNGAKMGEIRPKKCEGS